MGAPPGRASPRATQRPPRRGQSPRSVFGGVGEVTRPRHPLFSVRRPRCASRLASGEGYNFSRGAPLGAASRRRRAQVSSPVVSSPSTPPGIEWAHDGARYQSRHRNSSLLRSRGVVKAVLSSATKPRVEDVAQRVAEHVEPEHGQGDRDSGPDRHPRRAEHVRPARARQHRAPRRIRRWHAEA